MNFSDIEFFEVKTIRPKKPKLCAVTFRTNGSIAISVRAIEVIKSHESKIQTISVGVLKNKLWMAINRPEGAAVRLNAKGELVTNSRNISNKVKEFALKAGKKLDFEKGSIRISMGIEPVINNIVYFFPLITNSIEVLAKKGGNVK